MDTPYSFKISNRNCSADKIRLGAICQQDNIIASSNIGLIYGETSESFSIFKTHLAKLKQNHKAHFASPLYGI